MEKLEDDKKKLRGEGGKGMVSGNDWGHVRKHGGGGIRRLGGKSRFPLQGGGFCGDGVLTTWETRLDRQRKRRNDSPSERWSSRKRGRSVVGLDVGGGRKNLFVKEREADIGATRQGVCLERGLLGVGYGTKGNMSMREKKRRN